MFWFLFLAFLLPQLRTTNEIPWAVLFLFLFVVCFCSFTHRSELQQEERVERISKMDIIAVAKLLSVSRMKINEMRSKNERKHPTPRRRHRHVFLVTGSGLHWTACTLDCDTLNAVVQMYVKVQALVLCIGMSVKKELTAPRTPPNSQPKHIGLRKQNPHTRP